MLPPHPGAGGAGTLGAAATFELVSASGAATMPGPWHVAAGAADGLAFGTASAPAPVWRADLPADRGAALAALAEAEAALRRQDAAVSAAPERIVALASPAPVSYSARGQHAPALRPSELWLRDTIGGLRGVSPSPDAVSYGLRDEAATAWDEAAARFEAFAAQARDAVSNLAVVETRVGGDLVARTSVSWTGDVRSLFGGAPLYGDAGLHRRTLGLALESRAALLRTFGTLMRGAAIFAAMTSSPAGAALALPAAWRFVEQLLDELRVRN